MAPKKWDKNTAITYKLVHRPQNDPLIHDAGASSMVFQELLPPQAQKRGLTASESGSEYRSQAGDSEYDFRDNEGEAAEYGVYYDDTQYDYMQHLRDLGAESGDAHFIEATPVTVKAKGKGKEKVSLDEALKQLDLDHEKTQAESAGRLTDEAILPSKNLRYVSYQDQQDVPDALAGFQPDMDPRLREALEALEDEAYVDNDDQDLFDALAEGGEEIEVGEFEDEWYDEEDDEGWESDHTAKPSKEYQERKSRNEISSDIPFAPSEESPAPADLPSSDAAVPDAPSDPFAAFNAHKSHANLSKAPPSAVSAIKDSRMHGGAAASTVMSSASFLSRSGRKKRKGALTNPSAFSMTSSALHRTEGQATLDARFDRIMEAEYEEEGAFDADDGTASVATGMSAASSQAPGLIRKDYSSVMGMMDDFLGGFGGGPAQEGDSRASVHKGRKVRRGFGGQTGLQQLDEIRRDLRLA